MLQTPNGIKCRILQINAQFAPILCGLMKASSVAPAGPPIFKRSKMLFEHTGTSAAALPRPPPCHRPTRMPRGCVKPGSGQVSSKAMAVYPCLPYMRSLRLGRRGQSPLQLGHLRHPGLDQTRRQLHTQRSFPVLVVRQSNGAWRPSPTPQSMQNRRSMICLSVRGSGSRFRTMRPSLSTKADCGCSISKWSGDLTRKQT